MNRYYLLIVLISIILITSCGTDKFVVHPSYKNKYFKKTDLKRADIKVVKVYDKRADADSSYVGIAQTGMFNNETPYYLSTPVATFVQTSINKLIMYDSSSSNQIVPITITIDTLEVSEHTGFVSETGYFRCALNFTYPISSDSMGIISTYAIESASSSDVTDLLEDLIYKGIRNSTEQFITQYDKGIKFKVKSDSVPTKFTEEKKIPISKKEEAYKQYNVENDSRGSFIISYLSGNKIKSGIGAFYNTFNYTKDSQFNNGWGFGLSVLNVENPDDNIKGTYVQFGGKYLPRYFFSKNNEGLFLIGGLTLTCGTESEKGSNNSNFFFGPTIEEGLGLKLGPMLLEAGFYQLAFIGSKGLPNDVGFRLGIGLQP